MFRNLFRRAPEQSRDAPAMQPCDEKMHLPGHSIYIRTVSCCLILLIQFKLVSGLFGGQSNMHSTLDFCPISTRRKTNVPLKVS
jgi:hypothetical protein